MKESCRSDLPGCCFLGRIIFFGSLGLFCKAISQTMQMGGVCCGVNSTSTAGSRGMLQLMPGWEELPSHQLLPAFPYPCRNHFFLSPRCSFSDRCWKKTQEQDFPRQFPRQKMSGPDSFCLGKALLALCTVNAAGYLQGWE